MVVDGPFTAFDPYGSSARSLLGSAKNTNHWTTTDPDEPIPERYAPLAERPGFRADLVRAASRPCGRIDARGSRVREAVYLGSRFTIRVVENNPAAGSANAVRAGDSAKGEIHIFSGKVVSAVKAARLVSERITRRAEDASPDAIILIGLS